MERFLNLPRILLSSAKALSPVRFRADRLTQADRRFQLRVCV
jgi:hypothetical protein